jgi:SAM-dependent methyltransferase
MGMTERHDKCLAMVDRYYAGVPTRDSLLDEAVLAVVEAGHTLLDAGCGDTLLLLRRYASKVSFAVGLDVVTPSEDRVDRTAVTLGDLSRLPFRDGAFDLVVSRSVVEHLEDPATVFRELGRTLKPGGRLIFATPNKYYYSCLVALMIPYRWKAWYMRWMFGEDGYHHFPVFYRANTTRALRRVARRAALSVRSIRAVRHYPLYLMFSPVLFRLGMLYDWCVTALGLDFLQSNWLVVMERAGERRNG